MPTADYRRLFSVLYVFLHYNCGGNKNSCQNMHKYYLNTTKMQIKRRTNKSFLFYNLSLSTVLPHKNLMFLGFCLISFILLKHINYVYTYCIIHGEVHKKQREKI